MNIIEVLNLEPGTKVIDDEGNVFYLADGNIGIESEEKYLDYKKSLNKKMYLANINKTLANREFEIIGEYKKGDKIYINYLNSKEPVEAEFLCYCTNGTIAQVLIKEKNNFSIREANVRIISLKKDNSDKE